jgi:PPOX class probable FMN-dependent enzyme
MPEEALRVAQIQTVDQLRKIIPAPNARAFAKIRDRLCEQGIAFVNRSPFLALATIGTWGLEISQKGGDPGFVKVVDDQTLLIPECKGNQFALCLQNILAEPRVGVMLIRPATDEILRISGRATLRDDPEICARLTGGGHPALLAIQVTIDRAAFHCLRSARRAGLWNPATWDAPARISFGRIYAEGLKQPEVEELFQTLTEEHNQTLY